MEPRELPDRLEVLHQPARLRLMALLARHRDIAFTPARHALGLTAGNLASHARRLEQAGFLAARRVLTREGFEARYRITAEGDAAFRDYLAWLRGFLAEAAPEGGVAPDETSTAGGAAGRAMSPA